MSNRYYPSDDVPDELGQVDGDVAFTPRGAGAQPWLRAGIPPWHMWGNTQIISSVVEVPLAISGRAVTPGVGQLVKASYKRPTAWHWMFSSRLISGPGGNGGVADTVQLTVDFELTTGIGRSMITTTPQLISASSSLVSPAFERHTFTWAAQFPPNAQIWTTQALAPNRTFVVNGPAPTEPRSVIEQIVAQDIQLVCRVQAGSDPGDVSLGQTVVVEVSAQFSPVVHVRPDWFHRVPDEMRFAGDEVGGT